MPTLQYTKLDSLYTNSISIPNTYMTSFHAAGNSNSQDWKLARFEFNKVEIWKWDSYTFILPEQNITTILPSLHISVVALMKKLRSKLHWQPSTSSLCGSNILLVLKQKRPWPCQNKCRKSDKNIFRIISYKRRLKRIHPTMLTFS